MSEHVKKLRCVGEPCSTDEMVAEFAADHLERCEAALRDSTKLLRCAEVFAAGNMWDEVLSQIAANEAALGGKHDTDQK